MAQKGTKHVLSIWQYRNYLKLSIYIIILSFQSLMKKL